MTKLYKFRVIIRAFPGRTGQRLTEFYSDFDVEREVGDCIKNTAHECHVP